ncbi:MAG: PhiRv1 phage protein [Mycobacterium sp.]|nr:PhiRv1 phage protein [Mycobacterium sp.]
MPSANVLAPRGRLGALTRFRDATDPELALARVQMGEEKFVAAVERALKSAPPVTPEVRDRVRDLLADDAVERALKSAPPVTPEVRDRVRDVLADDAGVPAA